MLDLNFLELSDYSFLGLKFTLVDHDSGILIEFLQLDKSLLSSLLLFFIVGKYSFVDFLNTLYLALDLPLHDFNVSAYLIMGFINWYDFMIFVINFWENTIGAQKLLLGLAVNWNGAIVFKATNWMIWSNQQSVSIKGIAKTLSIFTHFN